MILYEVPIRLELTDSHLLVNGANHPRSVRTLSAMRTVLKDKEPQLDDSIELYYMFRKVHAANGLRYDITLIKPLFIGSEYNKTHGHYHPIAGKGLSYPEVYQVLRGRAIFIMQKKNKDGSFDVLTVSATTGDIVLIPPGYGHVSINQSESERLIVANVVCDGFQSMYEEYDLNHGAAFYYTKSGFVQNTAYIVRNFDRISPSDLCRRYRFSCADLLKEFYTTPEKFSFLKKPAMLARP